MGACTVTIDGSDGLPVELLDFEVEPEGGAESEPDAELDSDAAARG